MYCVTNFASRDQPRQKLLQGRSSREKSSRSFCGWASGGIESSRRRLVRTAVSKRSIFGMGKGRNVTGHDRDNDKRNPQTEPRNPGRVLKTQLGCVTAATGCLPSHHPSTMQPARTGEWPASIAPGPDVQMRPTCPCDIARREGGVGQEPTAFG